MGKDIDSGAGFGLVEGIEAQFFFSTSYVIYSKGNFDFATVQKLPPKTINAIIIRT